MEKYCICIHTLIPVRNTPSETAEMTTQLLFGELYFVDEILGKWARITTHFDTYSGWIDIKLIAEIDEQAYKQIADSNSLVPSESLVYLKDLHKNGTLPIVAGSSLPPLDAKGGFSLHGRQYEYSYPVERVAAIGANVVKLARQFENAPYLWGGRTVLGMDCSGLVQVVYKIVGIALPRDASMQINEGLAVNFIAEAQAGDLAFFDDDEGRIIHVGILLSDHEIIHASGWVKTERIDHQGIFNAELNRYSHKLRMIKRILK